MESAVALFPESKQAKLALETLSKKGFERDNLGFALTDAVTQKAMAQDLGISPEQGVPGGNSAAVRGAVLGTLIGAGLALPVWLALMTLPETRIYANGGLTSMLFGALGGAGMGFLFGILAGSDHSDFVKLLRRLGVPATQAESFYKGMQQGQVLVIAKNASAHKIDEALAIMQRYGAVKLD